MLQNGLKNLQEPNKCDLKDEKEGKITLRKDELIGETVDEIFTEEKNVDIKNDENVDLKLSLEKKENEVNIIKLETVKFVCDIDKITECGVIFFNFLTEIGYSPDLMKNFLKVPLFSELDSIFSLNIDGNESVNDTKSFLRFIKSFLNDKLNTESFVQKIMEWFIEKSKKNEKEKIVYIKSKFGKNCEIKHERCEFNIKKYEIEIIEILQKLELPYENSEPSSVDEFRCIIMYVIFLIAVNMKMLNSMSLVYVKICELVYKTSIDIPVEEIDSLEIGLVNDSVKIIEQSNLKYSHRQFIDLSLLNEKDTIIKQFEYQIACLEGEIESVKLISKNESDSYNNEIKELQIKFKKLYDEKCDIESKSLKTETNYSMLLDQVKKVGDKLKSEKKDKENLINEAISKKIRHYDEKTLKLEQYIQTLENETCGSREKILKLETDLKNTQNGYEATTKRLKRHMVLLEEDYSSQLLDLRQEYEKNNINFNQVNKEKVQLKTELMNKCLESESLKVDNDAIKMKHSKEQANCNILTKQNNTLKAIIDQLQNEKENKIENEHSYFENKIKLIEDDKNNLKKNCDEIKASAQNIILKDKISLFVEQDKQITDCRKTIDVLNDKLAKFEITNQSNSNTIDKDLIKNLILNYFTSGQSEKINVLKVIENVLSFEGDSKMKWRSVTGIDISSKESLSKEYISFLEKESS
ncbi:hypothetical protein A3Q56_02051 [Intoshia linei]|uniref:GRIP domain-containing protein n=1 Tax=Intoshia linei TaxID=1819745 RepID=A0A177B7B0_9BILA|nr:hypothetical protein A3Q56_02051 [Intoshia linei]